MCWDSDLARTPSNGQVGLSVTIPIALADGATATTKYTMPWKIRITDVWIVKTAGAGGLSDTVQLKNGATAISDAMSINVADQAIVRAATLDDAQTDIASGADLSITKTKASVANVACIVYVRGIRIA